MKKGSIIALIVGTIMAAPVLLIILLIGGYWWSNFGPFRPRSVPRTAVFLRGPAVGLPAPPRGEWLACWESNGQNHCRLSSKDGATEYEGVFIPYGRSVLVPADQLKIDGFKTRHEDADAEWTGRAWVPMVYLKNGDALIPADYYDKGTQILDQKRKKQQ
jgi:hypothetical protein